MPMLRPIRILTIASLYLGLIWQGALIPAAAQSPQLLDSVAAHYRQSRPFAVTFQLKVSGSSQSSLTGRFILGLNNRFAVFTPDQEIHYDGQWLWSYAKSNNQVIVEEFQPTTSFKIIYDLLNGNFRGFKISRPTSDKKLASITKIKLTHPDPQALFKQIDLWVDAQNKTITQAEYSDIQNNRWLLELGQVVTIEKKNYPNFTLPTGVELIDLRPTKGK